MSIQTKNFSNEKSTEAPPSYEAINVNVNNIESTEGSSNQGVVAKYTIYKSGWFKTRFRYQNDSGNEEYNVDVSFRSAKLIDDNDLPILSLKHGDFAFTTTTWIISYLVKNAETYSSIQLIKKTFELLPQYKLIFTKQDNTTIEYNFTLNSPLSSSWNLFYGNQLILKYNYHFFKKNTLDLCSAIDNEQFKIILLALSFLTIEDERRKHQSHGGGP